jgi:hypothetical protein
LDNFQTIDFPDSKAELREEMNEYELGAQSTPWPVTTTEHPLLIILMIVSIYQDASLELNNFPFLLWFVDFYPY